MTVALAPDDSAATTRILSDTDRRRFRQDGYLVIPDFWSAAALGRWENACNHMLHLQALKIAPLREKFPRLDPASYHTAEELDHVLGVLEQEDREAAYQAIMMIEHSAAGKAMISDPALLACASDLLDCPTELLVLAGPQPLINLPSTKRLLYHWHSETAYYPKRRNFLNVWFPMFRDKHQGNGTMHVCRGSHDVETRQFVEYQGFDKESHNKKNHFVQYEIPSCEVTQYEKVAVEVPRGALVLFHRALVHCGTPNASALPSYATVMRVCDMRRDLTLSANLGAVPFGTRAGRSDDYGRPGLEPLTY